MFFFVFYFTGARIYWPIDLEQRETIFRDIRNEEENDQPT